MDAADLDYRTRTRSGCIPPELVARLIDCGHAEAVALWAGRGEPFCALEWARLLGEQGRQAEALEVLAPYFATGWWTATAAVAELLEGWGRVAEAIEVTRARLALGHPLAFAYYTRLLARHGRADEAFTLLQPHVDDPALAQVLVDVAQDAGRDEEAAALFAARIRYEHECEEPWCCRGLAPYLAVGLLATVRERQGRVDEAVALLSARPFTALNGRNQLADILARHQRIDELRAYAATEQLGYATERLAKALEEHGDVEGAIAVLRQSEGLLASRPRSAVQLAQLLARHGRGDEAIDVMRVLADARNGDDWILHELSTLCAGQGRPEAGLAHLDALKEDRGGEEDWDLYWVRLPLMAACLGVDEAIRQARAHPEGDTWYAAEHIAALLAGASRIEEAVAVLQPHARELNRDLAGYLIDLGRVEEALALLRQNAPQPPTPWTGPWQDKPPF